MNEPTGCASCGSESRHVSRSQANEFSSSLPSGKEGDSEDFLNSGSVSTVLFDAPSLSDPEKSQTSTPVTASPVNDEFNVNIHEEVVFSPSFNAITPCKHCLWRSRVAAAKTQVSEKTLFSECEQVLVMCHILLASAVFLRKPLRNFV